MNNNVHDAIKETEKLLQGLAEVKNPATVKEEDSTPASATVDRPELSAFKSSEIPPPQDKDYPGDHFFDATMYSNEEFDAFRRLDTEFYSEMGEPTYFVDFFEESDKWEEVSSKDIFTSSPELANTEICSFENLIDRRFFVDNVNQTETKVVWDWMMIAGTVMFMCVAGFFMWPLSNLASVIVLLATSLLFLTCFQLKHERVVPTFRVQLFYSLNGEIIVKEKLFRKKELAIKTV